VSFLADTCALIAFHGGAGACMSREAWRAMTETGMSVSPIMGLEGERERGRG
jgi:hypothetical protein